MQPEQLLNDRYRLIDVVGTGGMSVVWRARDEVLGRMVAVKVLAPPRDADDALRGDMLAEARSAAMLLHPNVTNVLDYGESSDAEGRSVSFVVMELLVGPNLANRVAEGPLPPQEALRICAQVASAVAAAHAQGVVHRDIKPSNVVLTPAGAKVLDFGIAAPSGAPDLDRTGHILGTPAYLAPERLTGDGTWPAADVFALGVLIYRLLTRDLPWSNETPAQTLLAHLTVEPRPLPASEGVPWAVHDIYRRCLLKDPALRPTAAEVATVLTAAITARPAVPGDRADGDTLRLPAAAWVAERRRERVALIAGAAAASLAIIAVVLAATMSGETGGNGAAGPAAPTSVASAGVSETGGTPPTPGPTGATLAPVALPPAATPGPGAGGAPTTPSTPTVHTVIARGGAISVRCQGSTATILEVTPAPGYAIHGEDAGPASQVKVVLRSSTNESEIRARCGPSGVEPTVKESAR